MHVHSDTKLALQAWRGVAWSGMAEPQELWKDISFVHGRIDEQKSNVIYYDEIGHDAHELREIEEMDLKFRTISI